MFTFLYSLRFRLFLLLGLLLLPLLGLTLRTASAQRELAAAQAKAEALRVTRLVVSNQNTLTTSVHQLLIALAQLPEIRSGDPAECSALLAELLKQYPGYTNLNVAALNGDLLCSAIPTSGPINYADRAWFQRVLQTRNFVVGESVIGRITGKATLPLAYPVMNEAGELEFVVFAGIDLAFVNQLLATAQFPEGTAATVLDGDGTILARYPDPEQWVGKIPQDAPILQAILTQGEGTVETTGVDGVQRLYGFAPLGEALHVEGYVTVGIPSQVAYAGVNRILFDNLIGLGLAAMLTFTAAWLGGEFFVLRRTRTLARTAQQLTSGDLSARTGITRPRGELSQLGHAFDQMAAALQQREVERKRAEDALVTSKTYTESIIQNFLDTLIVVDAEAKIQTANTATCRLLGYTEEELKGQSVSMIFAEEEEEEEVKHMFQFFKEPEKAETLRPQDTIRNCELTYKTKDGRLIPMLFNASILTDEMGNVTGVVAGAKDITEIKQAQETLRKTEERFRDVIENIFKFVPEGLLVLTDKLNVFRRNKALEDLVHQYAEKLNYSEEELADIINEQVKMRVVSGEKSDIRIPRNQK